MVGEGIHSNEILHWRWSGKATRHPVKNQGLGFTQVCFSDVAGGGGGQQRRGQDDLIKAITWFLYLFRTCHLVTRAAAGSSCLTAISSVGKGAHGQCPPCSGHCPWSSVTQSGPSGRIQDTGSSKSKRSCSGRFHSAWSRPPADLLTRHSRDPEAGDPTAGGNRPGEGE